MSNIIEKVKAEFLDEDYIREPNYIIHRIDKGYKRYYLKIEDGKDPIIGASTTTILQSEMPKSPFLTKWEKEQSAKYGAMYVSWLLEQSANYGTFLHILYGELLRGMTLKFDIDSIMIRLETFCVSNDYDFKELMKWYKSEKRNIQKDIISFIQWIKDFKIRPIAIEYPFVVYTESVIYGGTIDLVCKANFKGIDKTIIVDFKSGKNFYESHEVQLKSYEDGWNIEYPDIKIEERYNFSPKDFRMIPDKEVNPTYNFVNQTGSEWSKRWGLYLKLYYMDESNKTIESRVDFGNTEINIESEISFIEYNEVEQILTEEAF